MDSSSVKERPILMNAPMVRAILNGTKTQTRRSFKNQPNELWHPGPVGMYAPTKVDRNGEEYPGDEVYGAADEDEGRICPYGKPGDRLWVRETFRTVWEIDTGYSGLKYKADGHCEDISDWNNTVPFIAATNDYWRPSIHMPRWASRITLEITDVRVERLQDISDTDAIAEGIEGHLDSFHFQNYSDPEDAHEIGYWMGPKASYSTLWNSINGKGAWDKNPWVWCVSFRRLEASRG